MRHIMFVTLAGAMLASCNDANSTKESAALTGDVSLHNATIAQVGEQVRAANNGGALMGPGHWEGTMRIAELQMAGMGNLPPAVAAQMKAKMSQAKPFSSCLTKEQAERPNGGFFGQAQANCSYDHFTMAGGKIDAAMKCGSGTAMHAMTMTGTYSRDAYQMQMAVSGGHADTGPGAMSMKMEMAAKRTGDCTPGEQ